MAELMECRSCGAANPVSADWCSQCYLVFDAVHAPQAPSSEAVSMPPPASERPAQPIPPPTPPVPGAPPGSLEISDFDWDAIAASDAPQEASSETGTPDSPTWQCRACETENPLDSEICGACGTSIYRNFGADNDRPTVSADDARRAALVPGMGYFRTDQGALGVAVGGFILVAGGLGITLLAAGQLLVGAIATLMALGVWIVSAIDAGNFAEGRVSDVLLKPRTISILTAVLVILIIFATLATTGSA